MKKEEEVVSLELALEQERVLEQAQVLAQEQVQARVLEQEQVQEQVQARVLEQVLVPVLGQVEQVEQALALLAPSCREHGQLAHPKTQHRTSFHRRHDKTPQGSIFHVSGSTDPQCMSV